MKGDFTRLTFDKSKHYRGVLMQQGRVQLDSDWNEQAQIAEHRYSTLLGDLVGASGAPVGEDGLRIELQGDTLMVKPGHIFVGGLLVENESDYPLPTPTGDGYYLYYLNVWPREVTAAEDPGLIEPALGGPDTTVRLRTEWLVSALASQTWEEPPASSGQLAISPLALSTADNRLYRVEVHQLGPQNPPQIQFKWSSDNGARVAGVVSIQGPTVTLGPNTLAVQQAFAGAEWVELCDDDAARNLADGYLGQVSFFDAEKCQIALETPPGRILNGSILARRWDGAHAIAVGAAGSLGPDLNVTVLAGTYLPGDYWWILVRGGKAAACTKPCDGPQHLHAPLALVQVHGGKIVPQNGQNVLDKRILFEPRTAYDLTTTGSACFGKVGVGFQDVNRLHNTQAVLEVDGNSNVNGIICVNALPALQVTGSANRGVFVGVGAVSSGDVDNTAVGFQALCNTADGYNTAVGCNALHSNTTGSGSTAVGCGALYANTTARSNTAVGFNALRSTTVGETNVGVGAAALESNTSGFENTAVGSAALLQNTTGSNNTAVGQNSLSASISGWNNIAIGYQAGCNVTKNSNILVGHEGDAADDSTIRIGTAQTKCFIAGIGSVKLDGVGGFPVFVTPSGQLGVHATTAEDVGALPIAGGEVTGDLTVDGKVGIGTSTPAASLQVSGGAIMPHPGNNESSGIMFPKDPAGGAGDAAWIRYYARSGEDMTLELGVSNDPTDHIALMPSGNVGIGTSTPAAKLQVSGGAIMPHPGNNESSGIMFPKDPGGGAGDTAWIRYYARSGEDMTLELGVSNDPTDHIALMPSGNVGIGTSAPSQKLEVNGSIKVSGNINTDGTLNVTGATTFSSHAVVNPPDFEDALYITSQQWSGSRWRIFRNAADGQYEPSGQSADYGLCMHDENTRKGVTFKSDGSVFIDGNLHCSGDKGGYVVDYFINGSGTVLEQGDVVVIAESVEMPYYGIDQNIPIPQVALTAKPYDHRVCGIVARFVSRADLPGMNPVGARGSAAKLPPEEHSLLKYVAPPEALDHREVAGGQIGKMVTLGTFAHCKVDADLAPIEAGDLLTTSSTKGHAQKVIDPSKAIGAIFAKALASLRNGKGKIPVIVTLQ